MWLGGLSHSSQQHVYTDLFNLEATCRVQRLNWDTVSSIAPSALSIFWERVSHRIWSSLLQLGCPPASQLLQSSRVFPSSGVVAATWLLTWILRTWTHACPESILLQVRLLVPVLLHFCRPRKSELKAHASSQLSPTMGHGPFTFSSVWCLSASVFTRPFLCVPLLLLCYPL